MVSFFSPDQRTMSHLVITMAVRGPIEILGAKLSQHFVLAPLDSTAGGEEGGKALLHGRQMNGLVFSPDQGTMSRLVITMAARVPLLFVIKVVFSNSPLQHVHTTMYCCYDTYIHYSSSWSRIMI